MSETRFSSGLISDSVRKFGASIAVVFCHSLSALSNAGFTAVRRFNNDAIDGSFAASDMYSKVLMSPSGDKAGTPLIPVKQAVVLGHSMKSGAAHGPVQVPPDLKYWPP